MPLNPVRAALCNSPGEWPWSSYAAIAGLRPSPWFLDSGRCIGLLGSADAYVEWVSGGVDRAILDEAGFRIPPARPALATLLLDDSVGSIACAHNAGYSQAAIAEHLGVSRSQISRRLALHTLGSGTQVVCLTPS